MSVWIQSLSPFFKSLPDFPLHVWESFLSEKTDRFSKAALTVNVRMFGCLMELKPPSGAWQSAGEGKTAIDDRNVSDYPLEVSTKPTDPDEGVRDESHTSLSRLIRAES